MSRANSPVIENLSSLGKITEFINGIKNIKTITKSMFPMCFKACLVFAYSPPILYEAPSIMLIKMIKDLNKLSETKTPLLFYFMNGMMIEFTLQTLHDKIHSEILDGIEIPAIQKRNGMIDKILSL